jgi:hypothetical protein
LVPLLKEKCLRHIVAVKKESRRLRHIVAPATLYLTYVNLI